MWGMICGNSINQTAIDSLSQSFPVLRCLNSGLIDAIATDHAPHLLSEKEGGALKAMSGMPMIQFSLVSMLELTEKGVFTIEKVVEKMAHAPAQMFSLLSSRMCVPLMGSIYICLEHNRLLQSIRFRDVLIQGQLDSLCG